MTQYLGKYRGVVVNNVDLEGRGRITAEVPDVYGIGGVSGWALPCLPFVGTGTGLFGVPPKGAYVWMEFEQGDPDYPIWTGGFWESKLEIPDPALGTLPLGVVLKTKGGSIVKVDDTPGKGGITVQSFDGTVLKLNIQGVSMKTKYGAIAVGPSGITIETATGQKLVIGPSIELSNGVAKLEMVANMIKLNGESLVVL
jgi:uncharacterized protein involved in type VI secretion and phage assembly